MSSPTIEKPLLSSIAIIGVGQVGGAAAYALTLGSVASELLLVDVNIEKRNGQVMDLSDTAYVAGSATRVRAATYLEARQCDIVVLTAGSKHTLASLASNIIDEMTPFKPDVILLVVSSPNDLITTLAQKLCGLKESQVLGLGTFLDSMRFRGLLADQAQVAADSVDINVLGTHEDFQVVEGGVATTSATGPGQPFVLEELNMSKFADKCQKRSQSIIIAKGTLPFGIGAVVSSICSSIFADKRIVRPISHFQPDFSCCFSLPMVLGRKGIISTIRPPLSNKQNRRLAKSANALRGVVDRIRANESSWPSY